MKTFTLIFLWSTYLLSQIDVKQDKLAHFGAGALISTVSYGVFFKHTKSAPKAIIYSTVCAFLVGAAKEVYDANKQNATGFDAEDFAVTVFGGLIASSFVTVAIKNKDKRKQLEKIEEFKKEEQLRKDIPLDATITDIGVIPKE